MQQYSLYLDHQSVAPLIRTLEHIIELTQKDQQYQYQTYELRLPIYQEFINILHKVYQEQKPELKLEDAEIKLEEQLIQKHGKKNQILNFGDIQQKGKRGTSNKNLQIQLKLIDWIIACDKKIFEKKQIDQKYCELNSTSKRPLPLKKIEQIIQKYKIKSIIVKTKNGEEHIMGEQSQEEEESLIKREELSKGFIACEMNFMEEEQIKSIEKSGEVKQQAHMIEMDMPQEEEPVLPDYLKEIILPNENGLEVESESEYGSLQLNDRK